MAKAKGSPKTGGRKPGSKNKATKAKEMAIAKAGITPLEFMLGVMKGKRIPLDVKGIDRMILQFDAAKAAAPYVHPRMTAITAIPLNPNDMNIVGQIDMIEAARRIAFALELAAPIEGESREVDA